MKTSSYDEEPSSQQLIFHDVEEKENDEKKEEAIPPIKLTLNRQSAVRSAWSNRWDKEEPEDESPGEKIMLLRNVKHFNDGITKSSETVDSSSEDGGEPSKMDSFEIPNTMDKVFASESSSKGFDVKIHREEFTDSVGTTRIMITNSESSLGGK